MNPALPQAAHVALRARLRAALQPGWRTRFAPAPTGRLHLGHAVNAVFVWSIARAFGGLVLVRIEDHDRLRARDEFDRGILEDLEWLGLHGDNLAAGFPAPLRQHADPAPFHAALDALDRDGRIYPCRCSRRQIAVDGTGPDALERRYPGTCRLARVPADETPARRVRIDDGVVLFDDLRHGTLHQVPAAQCGDLLVRDRNGHWTYQFAVVVDDIRQDVRLIIRGDDLLDSTGRQLLLGGMLGRTVAPLVLHHPLVTRPDGAKLSKSTGDTALCELRAAGWSAERALGHAAFLGGLQATPSPLGARDLASLWDGWR
ncbi:MAG: hypothetical protein IT355_08915 [Gemmatimonadaceae bacterium]|nr:hypothetical protein [Gemmatimonadaceae bacterium]